MKKLQERIRRLERLLGQKTEDVEILKETVRIGREKKLISRVPLVGVDDFEWLQLQERSISLARILLNN